MTATAWSCEQAGYGGRISARPIVVVVLAAALSACAGCSSGSPAGQHSTSSSTTAPPLSAGLTWGRPTTVSTSPLLAVSCASPSFCVAIDGAGDAYRFDGSQWTSPTLLPGPMGVGGDVAAVSCTSPSFCMAVPPGSTSVVQWNGTAWSSPVMVSANGLQGLSCVGTTFCAAVDGEGDAFEYNGSGWSRGAGDWGGVSGISCVSASFCVSSSGGISVFDGSTWTQPDQHGATSNFTGVSCPTTSYCLAVDSLGQALQFTGTWSTPVSLEPAGGAGTGPTPAGVSCWAAGACLVVDSAGRALPVINGPGAPVVVDSGHGLDAVSCAATLCVAVDAQGQAVAGKR